MGCPRHTQLHWRLQNRCVNPICITSNTNQAAQGPIRPGLEHLQGRGIHNLSGQPVPVSHHSLWKEQSNLASNLQLKTTSPWPAISYTIKELTPLLFVGSLYVLEGCKEVTPLPSLLQANKEI